MRKTIITAILLIALLIPSVSSYHYGNTIPVDFQHGIDYQNYRNDDYFCNYFDSNEIKIKQDKVCKWVNQGSFRDRILRARTVDFLVNSAVQRYDTTYYKTSGEAFCPNCKNTNPKPSNWRNKPAYDFITEGAGDLKNYYYKPRQNSEGFYNWRF